MGTCKECDKRHPSFYCPFDSKWEKIHSSFFDYFLGYHAIVCEDKRCVCRASTFMDTICEDSIRNSKRYGALVEEVLNRDNNIKKCKVCGVITTSKHECGRI